ncbi:MAG: VOC family protein [Proteobacteria bacterium]|nr:VOC family protein [Pseudomonadota bacterium]
MTTTSVLNATFSHIGICVSDIKRAKHFYKDAFGFMEGAVFESKNDINDLLGLSGKVEMTSQMLTLGSIIIELIYFKEPDAFASGNLRPMNQCGLTHLSFIVEDVDKAAAHLEACGARILHTTRTVLDSTTGGDPAVLIFCTDPDGTRIELYKPPSGWQADKP